MTRTDWLLAGVLVLGLTTPVRGQGSGTPEVDLRGISGSAQLMQIEMENFVLSDLTGSPEWLRQLDDVVHQDLDYSDLFWVTRWYRYPGEPAHPTSRALIRGTIEPRDGGWVLHGRVEELPGLHLIFETAYGFRQADHRRAAHRFADDIVAALTGQVGISRTRIAFVKLDGTAKEIWTIDYDGENARQLTHDGSLNISPTWSPDGKRLLYTTYVNGGPGIGLFNVDSGHSRVIPTQAGLNSAAAWSPDGARIAYTYSADGDADIWLIRPDGTDPRRITQTRGIDTSPSWSPTGQQIVFVSDRSGSPQVYVMGSNGVGVQRLTFAGSYNDSPDWSPRGEEIAFVSRDGNIQNVYVMSTTGDRMRPVVYGRGDCENPSWAPDGRHLVYSSLRGSERLLYVLDLETRRERVLTTGPGDCYGPAWGPVVASE